MERLGGEEKGYDPGLIKIYLYFDSAQTATPPHPIVWEIKAPGGNG